MFYYKYAQVISESSSVLVAFHGYKKNSVQWQYYCLITKHLLQRNLNKVYLFHLHFACTKPCSLQKASSKRHASGYFSQLKKLLFFITITNFQEQELWTFSKKKKNNNIFRFHWNNINVLSIYYVILI